MHFSGSTSVQASAQPSGPPDWVPDWFVLLFCVDPRGESISKEQEIEDRPPLHHDPGILLLGKITFYLV